MLQDFELSAFIEEDKHREAFYLRISAPVGGQAVGEYLCRVQAPLLFRGEKEIFGVDEVQARELALNFVKALLGTRRLMDAEGQSIEL